MALYQQRGSRIWWYEFRFAGRKIRESSKSRSKVVAAAAQRAHRRRLEENYNSIKKSELPKLFSAAAEEYIGLWRPNHAPKTMAIIERCVAQLLPFIGKKSVSDITPLDLKQIVHSRLADGASNRYANMTIETLRAILHRNHQWEHLRPYYKKLKEAKNIGKELSSEEETRLLSECKTSPSRGLHSAVILGLYCGMRHDEIRLLRWRQIDLREAFLTVGNSKTVYGEGRMIPLIGPALQEMKGWSARFPNRLPDHFVFPSEKYWFNTSKKVCMIHDHDPRKPIGSWKRAWGTARKRAEVHIRFHDLRHTTVTRLLDAGRTLEQVAPILGWSAATMAEMMIRYQHRNLENRRQTMLALVPPNEQSEKSKRKSRGN